MNICEAKELGITCDLCGYCQLDGERKICIIEYIPIEDCELCEDFISNEKCEKEMTNGDQIMGLKKC